MGRLQPLGQLQQLVREQLVILHLRFWMTEGFRIWCWPMVLQVCDFLVVLWQTVMAISFLVWESLLWVVLKIYLADKSLIDLQMQLTIINIVQQFLLQRCWHRHGTRIQLKRQEILSAERWRSLE